MPRILVLGGTGLLGAPVARRLQADGFDVRLLARDPDTARARFDDRFDVVAGDVADRDSLAAAMAGCDAVHISVGGPVDQVSAENVAALAARSGVERISYLSGATVDERNRWFPMVAQKLEAERALRASGVGYTIFCPTWPMEQLPRFVRDGAALVIGDRLPALHWFAAADLARMISRSLTTEEAVGRRLYVHGPQAWTMPEALERYCAAIHPEIEKVTVLPVEIARAQAAETGNQMLGFMADLMAYFDEAGELGDATETNRLVGPATTTLDAWIAVQAQTSGA